jgi:single-strand DNA-binding protein
MDLNKAMVIGRLTRDPESRTTPNGAQVASFSIATNTTWTDSNGARQEKVEFHNIVAWQKLAEICTKYLKKGSKVYIEGRLETRTWDAQDGSKRNRTEIIARDMIMLDSKGGSGGSNSASRESSSASADTKQASVKADDGASKPAKKAAEQEETINIEDIPF